MSERTSSQGVESNVSSPIRIPWKRVEPLSPADRTFNESLSALDALRKEWSRRLEALSEDERSKIRQRSLRRLAIETGLIERLYDVEWGLTLTLVAEGFTRDVIERANGKIDDRTLATLKAQLDSLGLVLDFVRQDRTLSTSFVKELHQAITRTQDSYVITDALGRVVESRLPKGEWKIHPNHVERQDGSIFEYTPPEHVASEMDRLIGIWSGYESDKQLHPLVKAAWLHHRFVQIHPFSDGNGRVARALTLLVLERQKYAPLVIDRWHRGDYLKAMDAANGGSLGDLTRLFVKLEGSALANELERPLEEPTSGLAVEVAHTLADQLVRKRREHEKKIADKLRTLGLVVSGRIDDWYKRKRTELMDVFKGRGLDAEIRVDTQNSPSEKVHWFRRQVTESAHKAGHYADFGGFVSWSNLRVRLEGWQLRYVASLHGAGRDIGVMAVTTFAEIEPYPRVSEADGEGQQEEAKTTEDAFRFVSSESVDDLNGRGQELEQLLEEGLAGALVDLLRKV